MSRRHRHEVLGALLLVCAAAGSARGETKAASAPSNAPVPPTTSGTEQRDVRTLATPQAASKNLWDGWRDDDRPRALLYAAPKAVIALFAVKWRPDVKDRGCDRTPRGGGPIRCFYAFEGGGANLTVRGNMVDGYRVTAVEVFGPPIHPTTIVSSSTTTAAPEKNGGSTSKRKTPSPP